MRLGVVMTGTGAYAAVNVGVLHALEARGIEPYAVCGLGAGAGVAAQYMCGFSAERMEEALAQTARLGRRMLRAEYSARVLMSGKKKWLAEGRMLGRLLALQSGEMQLVQCVHKGIIPCRMTPAGRRVVFSSAAYAHGPQVSLVMQVAVGFAVRSAMAAPPFLAPMCWLGSPLLPEENASWACGQLLRMGVDRVLLVVAEAAPSHEPDALELAFAARHWGMLDALPQDAAVLHIKTPCTVGALSFDKVQELSQAGREEADRQLDAVLHSMGMMICRVLPFKKRTETMSCLR